jgi:hypothetical protein
MWRLAVVRDDIDREFDGITTPKTGEVERAWEHAYFMRRLSVSVLEAKSLFDHDISLMLEKDSLRGVDQDYVRGRLRELKTTLDAIEDLLRPVRVALGGHVRPNSANPAKSDAAIESYDVRGLRTYARAEGVVTLNRGAAIGTCYRDFTAFAFYFVWPEATTQAALRAKIEEFVPRVEDAVRQILSAIDGVLYAFWVHVGAMEPGR